VGQAAALLTGLALLMNFRVVGAVFSYVAPLIWTWVIPLRGATGPRPTAACRGLLAFVLLLQFLHAYPIGGSQESWATFLFLPLVALGLGELRSWRPAAPAGVKTPPRGWPVLAAAIGIVLVAKTGWMARTAYQRFASRSDLALPGAMNLRLPESQRTAYQLLALNAVVHGDQLFSLPGMFSFNLWTDLPTPTRMNTTLWFTLLNDAEQAAIIAAIERAPRPCIIVQESLVRLMQAGQVPIRGILSDYVHRNFALAFRVEGFAFLVRSGRTIAPLDVARLTALAPARPAAPDTQIDLWLLSDGTPIEALEACDLTKPGAAQLTLNAANTQATLVAVDRANRQAGGPETAAWPLRFKGVAHLSLQFNRAGVALSPFTTEFHVKGPGNRTLGEVRINE
jgi:hypothetical protein